MLAFSILIVYVFINESGFSFYLANKKRRTGIRVDYLIKDEKSEIWKS